MDSLAAFETVTGGLPAQAWDQLAAGRLYSCRAWLDFCAHDVGGRTTAGAVHVDTGSGPAAVPVVAVSDEGNPNYRWDRQLTQRGLPTPASSGLLVGTDRGYQTRLLIGDEPDAARAASLLLDRLYELRAALPGSALMTAATPPLPCMAAYLTSRDVVALRAAGAPALPVLLNTDAWIAIPAGGWAAWLASLPSKGRRDSVKQEVRAFERAGYELRLVPLAESYREAAELLTAVQRRHGRPADVDTLAESLRRQAVAMTPLGEALFCGPPGEPAVGFCLFYAYGETLTVRAVGLDYDRLRGAAEYFNLVYYEMVRIAGQRSLRWLNPGIASGDVKALRGARLEPTWLLDLADDSVLIGHESTVRAANAARIAELTATPAAAKAFDFDTSLPFA